MLLNRFVYAFSCHCFLSHPPSPLSYPIFLCQHTPQDDWLPCLFSLIGWPELSVTERTKTISCLCLCVCAHVCVRVTASVSIRLSYSPMGWHACLTVFGTMRSYAWLPWLTISFTDGWLWNIFKDTVANCENVSLNISLEIVAVLKEVSKKNEQKVFFKILFHVHQFLMLRDNFFKPGNLYLKKGRISNPCATFFTCFKKNTD